MTNSVENEFNVGANMSTPPAYRALGESVLNEVSDIATTSAFSDLTLPESPSAPQVDICLAHLKLLSAFEELKTRTGMRNGLWDIWDSRAYNASQDAERDPKDVLALLREKRWVVYVARAVDRYEAWWNSFVPNMLTEAAMIDGKEKYVNFTQSQPMIWKEDMLPPLDVLLVWHTHMLNPRNYLEDCLRFGHGSLWAAGLPWLIVNHAINDRFEYTVSEATVANWTQKTGKAWANENDAMVKVTKCPACTYSHELPWTTSGQAEDSKGVRRPGIVGEGFGDGRLNWQCTICNITINHDVLRLAKFQRDVRNLINNDWPMPGTVIHSQTGLIEKQNADGDQLFPNRLIRKGILVEVVDLLKPGGSGEKSMMAVKELIESVTGPKGYRRTDSKQLKAVDKDPKGFSSLTIHQVSLSSRTHVRRMMSRYWQNHFPFALDLSGAVMRQGVFVNKMHKVYDQESVGMMEKRY